MTSTHSCIDGLLFKVFSIVSYIFQREFGLNVISAIAMNVTQHSNMLQGSPLMIIVPIGTTREDAFVLEWERSCLIVDLVNF